MITEPDAKFVDEVQRVFELLVHVASPADVDKLMAALQAEFPEVDVQSVFDVIRAKSARDNKLLQ
jgi:hypothetical protein